MHIATVTNYRCQKNLLLFIASTVSDYKIFGSDI